MEELFNPYNGEPETSWERFAREHTENWAPTVKLQMESATTWDEVKAIYEIHNKELEQLKKEFE